MQIRLAIIGILVALSSLYGGFPCKAAATTERTPPVDRSAVDLMKLTNSRPMPPLLCTAPQSCEMTFRLENIGYKDGGGYVVSWLKNMTIRLVEQGAQDRVTTEFDLQNITANTSDEQNTISISFYGSLGHLLKTVIVDVDRKHCGRIGPRHIEEASPEIIHSIASYTITQSTLSATQGGCAKQPTR